MMMTMISLSQSFHFIFPRDPDLLLLLWLSTWAGPPGQIQALIDSGAVVRIMDVLGANPQYDITHELVFTLSNITDKATKEQLLYLLQNVIIMSLRQKNMNFVDRLWLRRTVSC